MARTRWYIPTFVRLWRKECELITRHGALMQTFVDTYAPTHSAAFAAGLVAAQAFCTVLNEILPPPTP